MRRLQEIIDGEAVIRFTNEDTQNLPPGDYRWDIRVVIDPVWNEAHDDITGGAEVHAPFAFSGMPVLRILEVGAYV